MGLREAVWASLCREEERGGRSCLGLVMPGGGERREEDLSRPRCDRKRRRKEEGGPLLVPLCSFLGKIGWGVHSWPRYGGKEEKRRRTSPGLEYSSLLLPPIHLPGTHPVSSSRTTVITRPGQPHEAHGLLPPSSPSLTA